MEEPTEAVAAGVEAWRHMWGAKVQWPAEMPDDMLKKAIESTQRELAAIADWQTQGDDAVQALKKEFDTAWTPSWHVVIGKNFGSRVTHEARRQTFFYLGDKAVLIFKA